MFEKFKKNKKQEQLKKEIGVSKGGSQLYEYEEAENQEWRPPQAYGTYAEEVAKHFEELFPGRKSFVYHEILSDLVHIDVTIMRPTEDKNFYVVFTTGMSDLPMTLPEDIREKYHHLERAELVMFLPEDWNPGEEHTLSSDIPYEDYWPIQMIKYLARFPHEYKTWFGWGHTIPNGPNYTPIIDSSQMGGIILLELDNISPLVASDETPINIYLLMPAYREEIEYKLEYGMQALDDIFAEKDLPIVIDMHRENYCSGYSAE